MNKFTIISELCYNNNNEKGVNITKNHQSDNPLFKALVKKYESDITKTFATLIVYFDSSVGIGEQSTVYRGDG